MKKLFFAFAAIAMLAACETEGNGNKKPVGPGEFSQAESKVYVDVTATGWTEVAAWAWTEGGENYTGGEEATWPGIKLETTEEIDGVTYYVWTAPAKVDGQSIGFIANDNGAGEQTIDLAITPNSSTNVFVKLTEKNEDGKWLATVNGEDAKEPEKPEVTEPTSLEGHTWGLIGVVDWDNDIAMTVSNNVATVTFDAGENAEFKVRANGGWDINYGYNPEEEGALAPVDGTAFAGALNGGNIKVAETGNYTLTFTIEGETKTFTLKKN